MNYTQRPTVFQDITANVKYNECSIQDNYNQGASGIENVRIEIKTVSTK